MELHPKRQPGRTDRKAAVYASEIAQLRSAGYTYEAIREALADVGIELSTSALRREMRRLQADPRGLIGTAAILTQADARSDSIFVGAVSPRATGRLQRSRDRRSFLHRPSQQSAASNQGDSMKLAVINFSGSLGGAASRLDQISATLRLHRMNKGSAQTELTP